MSHVSRIVKHGGSRPSENFNYAKLHKSLKAACQSVHTPEGESEKIAELVTHDIASWIKDKPEVTSSDIRQHASRQLEHYNPDAAYLYKNHRMVM